MQGLQETMTDDVLSAILKALLVRRPFDSRVESIYQLATSGYMITVRPSHAACSWRLPSPDAVCHAVT